MEAIMNVSRRAVLAAIPAFAVPAGGIEARPDEDSDLLRLEAEVTWLNEAMFAGPLDTDETPQFEENDRLWHRTMQLICATPAAGFAGLAVKARSLQADVQGGQTNYSIDMAESLVADIRRLGGAS
jgi:hypothetical protein